MVAMKLLASLSFGLCSTLVSTFFLERSAPASYSEIMGCEDSCTVTATGWPMIFVRDYTGMSVVKTANIMEVWFAADRFDWLPFLVNVLFWSALCLVGLSVVGRGRG
jgi:hypothetical protein